MPNKKLLSKLSFIIAACFVWSLLYSSGAFALSPEQRRVLDSGIRRFDTERSDSECSLTGSGGSGNVNVAPDFSLGTDPVGRRVNLIKALMADYALTAEQAAGIIGNFMAESGGHHLPPDVNQGTTTGAPPNSSGLGYGWAQWSGGRKTLFIDFAVESGYMSSWNDHGTDASNYAYLKKELNEGYQSTVTELKKQTTPEDAAVSFEATFEKAGKPVLDKRKANARQAFDEYQSSGASPGTTTGSCGSAGSAAISGEYAFPLITTKSAIQNRGMFRDGTADVGGHPYIAYDILVSPGTPVAAFLSGTVVSVSSDRCPGRLLSIYNEESDLTISYLHLDFDNHAQMGEAVEVGQQIGLVGAAANGCDIPHLHIDAATGTTRPGCSRLSCPAQNRSRFVDIGAQLYETYQLLQD